MNGDDRDPTLYSLLAAAHRRAERIAEEGLFELGLSPMEARVLGAISVEDDRVHATGLARRAGLPVSTVTRALRRLERLGYVELRKGTTFDGRRLYAVLTGLGRRVWRGARDFEQEVDRELTARLSSLVSGALYSGLLEIVHQPSSDSPPVAGAPAPAENGPPRPTVAGLSAIGVGLRGRPNAAPDGPK